MGDGGSSGDPYDNAQDLTSYLGKILRIDIDHGDPYAIPPDNPFIQSPNTLDEIWAYGLRNPWRMSFDKLTGDLWIGDVGQSRIEEIDYEENSSQGGLNYGWRCYEGNKPYDQSGNCQPPFVEPLITRTHKSGDRSITGGYRYRGDEEGFGFHYIFGDFGSGNVYMAVLGKTPPVTLDTVLIVGHKPSIVSFAEDKEGGLYILTIDGNIYKIHLACEEPEISLPIDSICAGETILLTAESTADAFKWYRDGILLSGETTRTLTVNKEGHYSVQAYDLCISDTSEAVSIHLTSLPEPQLLGPIHEGNNTLIQTDSGYGQYIWFYSETSTDLDDFIALDTTEVAQFTIHEDGNYYVKVVDEKGCSAISEIKNINLTRNMDVDLNRIRFYPNPVEDILHINGLNSSHQVEISIFTIQGRRIFYNKHTLPTNISLRRLEDGIYFLHVVQSRQIIRRKLIKG